MALVGRAENQKATSNKGTLLSLKVTLTATVPLVVNLPDYAQGFALKPTQEIRFAVNETTQTEVTTVNNPVLANEFRVGAIAEANLWEVRTISEGANRYLSLLSLTNGTCVVEVF